MPSLRPPSVAIWVATPTTRPERSSTGPPEFPGLRAASVWMTPVIAKPFGESICLRSPETIPLDSDPCRPKGAPIATTGSPTLQAGRVGEGERAHVAGRDVELQHGEIDRGLDAPHMRTHATPADGDHDLVLLADHVGVRHHVVGAVDQETRPGAPAGRHRHHRRRGLAVDRAHVGGRGVSAARPGELDPCGRAEADQGERRHQPAHRRGHHHDPDRIRASPPHPRLPGSATFHDQCASAPAPPHRPRAGWPPPRPTSSGARAGTGARGRRGPTLTVCPARRAAPHEVHIPPRARRRHRDRAQLERPRAPGPAHVDARHRDLPRDQPGAGRQRPLRDGGRRVARLLRLDPAARARSRAPGAARGHADRRHHALALRGRGAFRRHVPVGRGRVPHRRRRPGRHRAAGRRLRGRRPDPRHTLGGRWRVRAGSGSSTWRC